MVTMALLKDHLCEKALSLGFSGLGVSYPLLEAHGDWLQQWWDKGYGGTMAYLVRHGAKRWIIKELVAESCCVISLLYPSWPQGANTDEALANPDTAYIARYALGRDYHKVLRKRLSQLCHWLDEQVPGSIQRGFVDSAPVLEKALAAQGGLGWIGKNTLLLNRTAGSAFYIGEIYTSIALPADLPETAHCGSCSACMDICPTRALVAPYQLDATLCISYWTIESRDPIPEALRPAFGNRIFGCDDCQWVCPWNRYAQLAKDTDLQVRHRLHQRSLADLARLSEQEYLNLSEGSALRRCGYSGFLRNIAVGLGNARRSAENTQAIRQLQASDSPLVQEHAHWAARQQHLP